MEEPRLTGKDGKSIRKMYMAFSVSKETSSNEIEWTLHDKGITNSILPGMELVVASSNDKSNVVSISEKGVIVDKKMCSNHKCVLLKGEIIIVHHDIIKSDER